jgi:hypothetical protein
MWKVTQDKAKTTLANTCLLHGGIADSPTSRPDVSVIAYLGGTIVIAIDKSFEAAELVINRQDAIDLIALLTEALAVTEDVS